MRYATQLRLRLIDFLLAQYGHVSRSAITNFFGVSMPQATRDFKKYLELAPKNMEYSSLDKVYKRTIQFKRLYM